MSTTTPVRSTTGASPPVFNLTRAIALLNASAESGVAFCTPWQPYCAGEGLRTSFLVGEGAPFSPLNGQSSDAYTDIVRLEKEFYLRVIKDERRQTSHVIAPGEDWLKIAFALDGGGLAQTFAQKSSYEYSAGRVEIYLHPPGIAKTEGVADGRWGSDVVISPPHLWQKRFNACDVAVEPRIDTPVAPAIVQALEKFPDFRRASTEGGLTREEFDTFPPTRRTLRQFITACHDLDAQIRELMLPNPELGG